MKEQEFFGQPPLNFKISQYSSYCHDAAWTLAFALNNTINSKLFKTHEVKYVPYSSKFSRAKIFMIFVKLR